MSAETRDGLEMLTDLWQNSDTVALSFAFFIPSSVAILLVSLL